MPPGSLAVWVGCRRNCNPDLRLCLGRNSRAPAGKDRIEFQLCRKVVVYFDALAPPPFPQPGTDRNRLEILPKTAQSRSLFRRGRPSLHRNRLEILPKTAQSSSRKRIEILSKIAQSSSLFQPAPPRTGIDWKFCPKLSKVAVEFAWVVVGVVGARPTEIGTIATQLLVCPGEFEIGTIATQLLVCLYPTWLLGATGRFTALLEGLALLLRS